MVPTNQFAQQQRVVLKRKKAYFFVKRAMDIVGSLFGLIILSPVFLLIALAIKIEEPFAPVFFSQTRVGMYQKTFKIYKFRSMHVGAEEKLSELKKFNDHKSNIMFKMKDDPRITKVGRVIRKLSLDELPQLFNVLVGDMSLVGPRPPLECEVLQYSLYDMHRLLVKPGCTGLWQVTGRNSIDFDGMVQLDLYYIQKQSFLFDCYLILKTFKVMLFPNEAY